MKKSIALLLSVLLMLSVFVAPTFAEEEVNADFAFMAAMGFVNAEEVFPDSEVTRLELAQVFYNIMIEKGIDYSPYYGEADFKDVPPEKKDVAAVVYGTNIMRGYADGLFHPDDKVTFNQLVKAMVSFLGYDVHAASFGGWPSGYLTQANVLGILPSAKVFGDSVATYAAVAEMFKRALSCDIALWENDTPKVQEGVNYLQYWCGIYGKKGTVTGNYLTNISGDAIPTYFGIYLEDEYFEVALSAAGIQDMIGYQLYIYYQEINGNNTVIHFEETGKNVIADIKGADMVSATTSDITVADGAKDVKYNLASDATVIYNGSYLGSYSAADINPFKDGAKDGSVRLIDKNYDSRYDMVIINAYDIYVVSAVGSTRIYNVYKPSEYIDIADYEERNIDICNVYGEPVNPDSIKKGHVMSVCKDKSGNVKRIILSNDLITGKIQEVERAGKTITAVKVNEITFDVSPAVTTLDAASRLAPGVDVKLYFGCEGTVAYIDVDTQFSAGYQAGLLVDMAQESGMMGGTSAMVFGSDGIMYTMEFGTVTQINGTPTEEKDVLSKFELDTDGRVKRQAILYQTNDDMTEITAIEIADTSGKYSDGFYKFAPGTGAEGAYTYKGSFRSFDDKFVTDNSTVVFTTPTLDKRDNFDDYGLGALDTDEGTDSIVADCYGTSKAGLFANIVVINAANAASTQSGYRPIFMVSKVSEAMDDEDSEIKYKIEGWYVERTTLVEGYFIISKELVKESMNRVPDKGDIFRISSFKNTNSRVERIAAGEYVDVFDFSEKKFIDPSGKYQEGGSSHYHRYGKVMEKSGDVVKIKLYNEDPSAPAEYEVYLLTANYFRIIELQTKPNGEIISIKPGVSDCVIAENDCPGEGSDVVMYSRGSGIAIFVLN